MNNFIQKVKAHKVATSVIVIILIAGGYYIYGKMHSTAGAIRYVTQAAQKTTITVGVSGTGQVSNENSISIKPQGSGTVTEVDVKQGDTVNTGQRILILDEKNASVSLRQAQASLTSAQANYDKVLAGTATVDVQTAQAGVTSAQNTLDNAKTSYANTVSQQQLAVQKAYTTMMSADLTAQAAGGNTSTATVTVTGGYSGQTQGTETIMTTNTGAGLYLSATGLMSATGPLTRGVPIAIGNSGLYITFSSSGSLIGGDSWTILIPNTSASSYSTNSNAYQAALQNQQQTIATAQAQIQTAQLALDQAKATLASKIAPPADADVASAKAQVQTAQAQLSSAQIAYANNIVTVPFAGVIASLTVQKGDQASSGTAVATLITQQQIANVSLNEVDVAKIKIGDKATLSFSAISGLNLSGTVEQIDTVGTVSQGVVTYNVKIGFDAQDPRVKPGMSASATIITDIKTDVVAVPGGAVKTDSSGSYVQELDSSGKVQTVPVQTGISNDSLVEITSGLNAGDSVITQTINPNAKTSTTASNSAAGRAGGLGGASIFGGGGGGGGAAGRALGR